MNCVICNIPAMEGSQFCVAHSTSERAIAYLDFQSLGGTLTYYAYSQIKVDFEMMDQPITNEQLIEMVGKLFPNEGKNDTPDA